MPCPTPPRYTLPTRIANNPPPAIVCASPQTGLNRHRLRKKAIETARNPPAAPLDRTRPSAAHRRPVGAGALAGQPARLVPLTEHPRRARDSCLHGFGYGLSGALPEPCPARCTGPPLAGAVESTECACPARTSPAHARALPSQAFPRSARNFGACRARCGLRPAGSSPGKALARPEQALTPARPGPSPACEIRAPGWDNADAHRQWRAADRREASGGRRPGYCSAARSRSRRQ